MKTLPLHYARCEGVFFLAGGRVDYREGCENCLRRIAPHPDCDIYMAPPPIIAFECEYLIEDDRNVNNKQNF